jgi:hypothetical protein
MIPHFRKKLNTFFSIKAVLHSAFWGFGLPFRKDQRQELSDLLKNVFPDFSPSSFLTYNFSDEENDWSSIKSSILNNNFLTQEFIQISYLIHFFIINGRPTLLIWQSCSGKFSKFQATIS